MVRQIQRLQGRVGIIAATLCLALAGCGADEQNVGTPNKPEPRQEALSAGQIADVVTTINQADVKQAQDALDHIEDTAVHAYAESLVADHQSADRELEAVVTKLSVKPEPSALKTDLELQIEKLNQMLADEAPAQYAATFVEVQAEMHMKAIAAVDQMSKQATQPEMRAYLENLRATLQKHLETARQLRKRFPEHPTSR